MRQVNSKQVFWKTIVLVIVFFLLLVPLVSYLFVLNESTSTSPVLDHEFKVMTYNLHYGIGMDNAFDPGRIADFVASKGIDIVGFEELSHDFVLNTGGDFASLLVFEMEKKGYAYNAFSDMYNGGLFNGIFSKYPILDSEYFIIEPRIVLYRTMVHAVIQVNDSYKLDVFVTHLSHIYEDKSNPDRVKQVEFIMDKIKSAKNPVLLMGDFNSLPDWPEITTVTDHGFIDAWAWTNPSNDTATWPANDPEIHIDYIFVSPSITPLSTVIYSTLISDHLPLASTLHL